MMLPGYRAPGGPLDNLPPGERPPHPADRPYFEGPQPYGKRRHPGDYRCVSANLLSINYSVVEIFAY